MALKMKWEFWHLLLKTKEYFTASALPANPPYGTLECFYRDTITIYRDTITKKDVLDVV